MPKIAITGATSFIGQRFVYRAAAKGCDVRLLVRSRPPVAFRQFETIRLNLDDEIIDPICLAGCDALIHLAARVPTNQNDPAEAQRCWHTNAIGTLRLLDAARVSRVAHIIHTVSANAYRTNRDRADEEAPLYPTARAPYYLMSKIAQEVFAEFWAKSNETHVTCLRLGSVYGPGQSRGVLPMIAKSLLAGDSIHLANVGRFGADFVLVDDVVDALWMFLLNGIRGVFNIGSGERTTLWEIAALLADLTGRHHDLIEQAPADNSDTGFPALDVSKAVTVGFEPTSIRLGLQALIEWLKT